MNNYKYRITLYSRRWSEEIVTYNFPDCLPVSGDLIEILDEDVYFVVSGRSFKREHSNLKELIPVFLYGEIEGHDENTPKSKLDSILTKLEIKLALNQMSTF